MYDFWESTLLDAQSYKGNPMIKHIQLSQNRQIERNHFDRWLFLWESTIHSLFEGPVSDDGVQRARQIAELMQYKIKQDREWFGR